MKIIALLLLFSGCASVYNYHIAFERYAIVQDSLNIGSGVRCGNRLILTASHLVADTAAITVTNREFTAVPTILSVDLASLYGDDAFLDTVEYADVWLGQEVFWIQPRFEPGGGAFLTFGRVAAILDSSFYVDRAVMFGASGSGVWSPAGKLVGIMQAIVPINSYPMYARATRLWAYKKGGGL